ncbi:hypothetical protein ACU8V3_13375 [Cobetia marina]
MSDNRSESAVAPQAQNTVFAPQSSLLDSIISESRVARSRPSAPVRAT